MTVRRVSRHLPSANPLANAVGEVRALGFEKRGLRAHAQRGLG